MSVPLPSGATAPDPAPASTADYTLQRLPDGTRIRIRAVRVDDMGLERDFIVGLSPESRRLRFFGTIGEPTPALLRQLTAIDRADDVAYIALEDGPGPEREIGVARYSLGADRLSCECAIVVADAWHRRGVARVLMRRIIGIARARGIHTMTSCELSGNRAMQELAESLGFLRLPTRGDAREAIHLLHL